MEKETTYKKKLFEVGIAGWQKSSSQTNFQNASF